MKSIWLAAAGVILLQGLTSFGAAATTIRVPADQANIQSGIDAASNGDTVLVFPGTYTGNINFNGKKIVVGSLYIIAGDTSDISGTTIQGNGTVPAVVFSSGEDSTSVLIGFSITKGSKGIYCSNSNPTLAHCAIINNISEDFGGGIYCTNSSPTLSCLTIENNDCYFDGGGLYCWHSSPCLWDVTISGNVALGGDGGGIYCGNGSSPTIRSCVVAKNAVGWYGGGVACYDSSPIFSGCTVSGNESSSWFGGGFYSNNSTPVLENSLITHNKVDESVGVGSGGGGICCDNHSSVSLSGVTITRNSALVAGGGIQLEDDSSRVVFDTTNRCNIYLNEAGVGSDIYSYWNKTRVVVDTFTVLYPTNDQLFPIGNFSYSILHGKISQNQNVLFVSPLGSNDNSGTSPHAPLRTIAFAKSIIRGTPQKQATIYLSPGTFSRGTNGEHFELDLPSYITLKGSGTGKTIMKGDGEAGVLFYSSVTSDTVVDVTIENGGFGLGGGVYCSSSDVYMRNVVIKGCNSSEGGAVSIFFGANLTLENALIYGNSATLWGGAFSSYHANCNFINVTMADNTANGQGGGIYCQTGHVNLINSVLWNDSPEEIYFYEMDSPSSINIINSDVKGGRTGIKENGNGTVAWDSTADFYLDPLFVDASRGNFHLGRNSPCIGAGVDSVYLDGSWFFAPYEDVEDAIRAGSTYTPPDIGAFKYDSTKATGVSYQANSVPTAYKLFQNYPNPFNPSTVIAYQLPKSAFVTLKIYDILGREVRSLVDHREGPGCYNVTFNASGLPSGIYFCRLEVGPYHETRKLLLLK